MSMIRVSGFGSRASAGGAFKKPRTYLSGDFARDMTALRIKGTIRDPRTRRDQKVDETATFVAYLTLALENISNILGLGEKEELSGFKSRDAVKQKLDAKKDKLFSLASFLWMFRENEPQFDFGRVKKGASEREYETLAKDIVVKLWELRNMFVHSYDAKASSVLVVTPEFYRFIEGELYSEARENALGPGRKTEKIFKLKLFTPHNDRNTEYEFTRKGIIYLICLALYRHDANEFIQRFRDMQLPPREWEVEKGFKPEKSEQELVELRKKGGSVKAILDAFTFFSMRASRTDIDVENADYLNFANILLYLNKVPQPAYDYLALKAEAESLSKAGLESSESAENKRFKYVLQARKKDRFLTMALAYLEDFSGLKCLKFKRLDITVRPERKRYLFGRIPEGATNEMGEAIKDANGMDRHYAIRNGVAQFEFMPAKHYGPIHITSLRGGIGEDEIMRLLFVLHGANGAKRQDPDRVISDYLTAYHRILERMVNAADVTLLSLDDPQFRADFKTVSGKGDEALEPSVFVEAMKPFFSVSITRFFVGKDLRPTTAELQRKLAAHLTALEDRARDTLIRLDHHEEWRGMDADERAAAGRPVCAIGELRFPPRTCRFNDGQLVQKVLDYLNFYLTKEEKYRQLPRGMRHRGVTDFEFQLLHTDIGRFAQDPSRLWETLGKRDSLNGEQGPLEALRNRERELFRAEERRCRGRLDRNGRPLRVGHTLTMLAYAATELLSEACEAARETWCGRLSDEDLEILPYVVPQYGVKAGQALNRDALVKSVLGIDLESWSHAYDYAAGKNYENRELVSAKELIAAQIPMPNDFARRCVEQPKDGVFQFNPAMRTFKPFGEMALRDYYDVRPLIAAVQKLDAATKALSRVEGEHARANAPIDPTLPGLESRVRRSGEEDAGDAYGKMAPGPREISRSVVNKAIQAIQRAERQDKVLLACAREYWKRYAASENMSSAKKAKLAVGLESATDVGKFFTIELEETIEGEKVSMMPNDFARPAYSAVTKHIKELARRTPKRTDGTYAFYDLWLTLRDLQRKENTIRLELLGADVRFDTLVNFPRLQEELSKAEIAERLFIHAQKSLRAVAKDPLTREEFDLISSISKRLRHPTQGEIGLLDQNVEEARRIYRRFGCLTDLS